MRYRIKQKGELWSVYRERDGQISGSAIIIAHTCARAMEKLRTHIRRTTSNKRGIHATR